MDDYESGYAVIQWVQSWSNPVFDTLFVSITTLGMGFFYLLAIPVIYWCVNKSFAARLCFIFLFSMFLNSWMKVFTGTERPNPSRVRILYPQSASGYAFPSGHVQGSVAFWGYCATRVRKWYFSIFTFVLIFLMCLSRIYLGFHFPVDLIGGVLLGSGSLLVFIVLLLIYEKIRHKVPWWMWLVLLVIASAILIWFFPEKRFAVIIGSFTGFFIGVALEKRFLDFKPRRSLRVQCKKIGWGFLGAVVPVCCGLPVYLAYALGGAWVGFGAPWWFKKRGWA